MAVVRGRRLDKSARPRTVHGVRFATGPENRTRLLWTTSVAVTVSVAAGLGLVLTTGENASVTAATPATTVAPEVVDTTAVAAPTPPSSTVAEPTTETTTEMTGATTTTARRP